MAPPLVSLLIPSYKPEHFELALASALAQTYEHREIIVSDDCPTDAIEQICRRWPHVQYSRNPLKGPNTNLRRLTELAQGEYLKYLMDDDILHPLCVTQMVDALADPSVSLVFSARDRIDADSRIVSRDRAVNTTEPIKRLAGSGLRRHCLLNCRNIIGEFTTVMFRKSDVVRPGAEPIYVDYHGEEIRGLTDIACFLQLLERGDAAYFSEPLSLFRVHDAANTRDLASPGVAAGVAEWGLFARQVAADPDFSVSEKLQALDQARAMMGRMLHIHPGLSEQIAMVDAAAAPLRGSA